MAMLQTTFLQQCPLSSAFPHSFLHSPSSTASMYSSSSAKFKVYACSQTTSSPTMSAVNGNGDYRVPQRTEIRVGLPSKGRMASDTLDLLKDCQLSVKQVNPRQYVAQIPQLSNVEVWFQRPKDIVKKLLSGDLDLGMVGLDTFSEYGQPLASLGQLHHLCLSMDYIRICFELFPVHYGYRLTFEEDSTSLEMHKQVGTVENTLV